MKLLILDDDIQIREGLERGIDWKSAGFEEVRSVGDGVTGLRLAREMAPDIVLSDVRMPGMDGLEFLRAVKGMFPRIKVVLISGYDDFEYLQKAVRYHADAYELKPVKIRSLLSLIGDLKANMGTEEELPRGEGRYGSGHGPGHGSEHGSGHSPRPFPEQSFSGAYSLRIRRAIDYVNSHLAADLSARNLGVLLGISPNYFSALFKQETGTSFNGFVNRVRLENAAYFLEHTDGRISEIAASTGFRDVVYFSQVFRKTYGCCPSRYRKGS
jgi:two-component system response regulator YesN